MSLNLPRAFLHAAAPGYLTETQWTDLGPDWERHVAAALEETARQCKGARGPLTPVIPLPGDSLLPDVGKPWRLADYLEQHCRDTRRALIPPKDFWNAALSHASPGDLPALARAAEDRGLLRDAARLRKHAAEHGSTRSAATLVRTLHALHPADLRPAQWAAAHAALDDAYGVASLLNALREAGAGEQATALASRNPAASVSLDNPFAVPDVLNALGWAGAHEQAAVLAARAAAGTVLDDPFAVAELLHAVRWAGGGEQVAVLAGRNPAASVCLGNPRAVEYLLNALRWAGAHEQAAALTARASLDDSHDPAGQQVAALSSRKPSAGSALDNPHDPADLLNAPREAGTGQQRRNLVSRLPAEGHFRVFLEEPGHKSQYRFGREPDESPAPEWNWADLG